ncbi:MAG: alpha/beta hydrolase [Caulobacteraceae bacterium]
MARITPWLMGGAGLLTAAAGGLALFNGLTARKIETAFPPQGRFIEVEGAKLHYLDVGEGPAIVMIHGLGGQMRNFTYALVDRLKERFRVIVVERPGSGYSQRAPGVSARLTVQASAIAAFIRALELDHPLVVGHSLGGAVALALALDHREQVGGLALIAPFTQPQSEVPPLFRGLAVPWPWLRWLVGWTVAAPAAMLHRQETLEVLFGPEPAPGDFATKGGSLLSLRPASYYAASTDMMAVDQDMPALAARYGELDLPVGVLFGTGDRILDAAVNGQGLVGKIAGLDLELIEDGGHMIPLTQPQRVADFVARIAGRIGARAPVKAI